MAFRPTDARKRGLSGNILMKAARRSAGKHWKARRISTVGMVLSDIHHFQDLGISVAYWISFGLAFVDKRGLSGNILMKAARRSAGKHWKARRKRHRTSE
jgi:hypothetical protein